MGSNFAISHRQAQSPLTQGWRYGAARDYIGSLLDINSGMAVVISELLQVQGLEPWRPSWSRRRLVSVLTPVGRTGCNINHPTSLQTAPIIHQPAAWPAVS